MYTVSRKSNDEIWAESGVYGPPKNPTLRETTDYNSDFPSEARRVALEASNMARVTRSVASQLGVSTINQEQVRAALVRASNLELLPDQVNARAEALLLEEIRTVGDAHARYVASLGPDLRRGGSIRQGQIMPRSTLVTKKIQHTPSAMPTLYLS